jgi:hypothetical protein
MPIDINTFSAQEQATLVYIAYYDRAPDPAGLQFYGGLIAGDNGFTVEDAATDFSGAAETKLKYPYFDTPDVATASTFLISVYANLFGRAPDPLGLEFWTDQLTSGATSVGEIILAIAEGAQGDDIAVVTNKIAVGLDWAQDAANAGIGTNINPIASEVDGNLVVYNASAFTSATTVLDSVTADPASVDAAKALTDVFIAGDVNIGETIYLTTAPEAVVIDTVNTIDTVRGLLDDDGTNDNDTFSSGDSIEGNGLTNVRLTLVDVDSANADFVEMTGVNGLEFRGAGETGPVYFDASNYGTDLNNFTLSGGDGANVYVNDVEFDDGPLSFQIAEGTTGDLNVYGTQGDWSLTADLSATGLGSASIISDIGGAGITAFAGEDAEVYFDAEISVSESGGADAVIADVNVGDVTLMADGEWAEVDLSLSFDARADDGNATIGDVTLGGINVTASGYYADADFGLDLDVDVNGDGDATIGNVTLGGINVTASGEDADAGFDLDRRADVSGDGDATIGDLTVGDVSVMNVGGTDAEASADFYARADARGVGDASVGNTTFGDINLTAGDDASSFSFSVTSYAYADTGNATIGNLTLGDISVLVGDDAYSNYFYNYRRASVDVIGDATIGDINVGDINGVFGVGYSYQYFSFENDASVYGSGNATAGDITLGNITFAIGEDQSVTVSISNSAYVSATGDATVGNVTLGDINLTQASGSEFDLDIEAYANPGAAGNGIVGDVTIGSITSVMNINTSLDIDVSVTAYGTGTMTSIGDVTIGDVTLSGPVAIGAEASLDIYVRSEGDIGMLTVGAVDVDFLADSSFTYDIYVNADGDVGAINLGAVDVVAESILNTVDIFATGNIAGVTMGDVTLAGDNIDWSSFNIGASGDIGDVTIGNVSLDAATNLYIYDGITIDASGDLGNVMIGDISIDTPNSETFNVYVHAGDDIGNVAVGSIETMASNVDVEVNVTVTGSQDVGNVSVGDISLSATASTAAASANAYFEFDAGTGDNLGNVTFGDISLASSGAAELGNWASAWARIGDDAGAVGDILIGDVSIAATAENVAVLRDGSSDWGGGGVYIYADQGASVSSMTVGDVDFTLTNSVDDSTAFNATADEYNIAYATLSVTSDSAITVGDINLTAINASTVDVQAGIDTEGLFEFNITLDADSGAADITIGDITIVGGAVDTAGAALDNMATLTSLLSLSGDTITVGDIDYSGYATDASIDVSGYEGAANITAAAGDTTITVNTTQNLVTLGAGDDTVIYTADEDSGTTYADIDSISGFVSGSDTIDFSSDGDISNYDAGGTFADYDTFLVAAQQAMAFDSSIDVFSGNDGTNTYVAVETDDDAGNLIDYVIELAGVTSVNAGDFVV